MKHLIILAVAFLLFNAQSTQAQDAKAKGILESASKKMRGLKSLKSAFSLKMIAKNGELGLAKKGTFLMKGPKYHIVLPDQEIICDGITIWTYMKDVKEVQVSTYNPDEQALSPAKLFTNFYDKEYSCRFLGLRKVGGKMCSVVEMVPVAGGKQIAKVDLAFDAANTIVGGNIFEKNGAQYRYEVSNLKPNATVSDAQFTYDAKTHPGVELVDLR